MHELDPHKVRLILYPDGVDTLWKQDPLSGSKKYTPSWGGEAEGRFKGNWKQCRTAGESEVSQSCQTLCNPMDCSLSGSSVYGIFQARVLEWIAISFSRGSSRPRNQTQVSCIAGRCFTIWATREAPGCTPGQLVHHTNYMSEHITSNSC